MPFTEFCCRSGGSNLNAGSRTGSSTEPGTSPDFEFVSGSWVASTGVFTPASGDPAALGVAVGDFASVYADGSTVTGFVGRVTAVSSTTITVSTTVKAGTAPTDGSGNRTLRIGGAWLGPNGAIAFPGTLASPVLTNVAAQPMRVNFKNDQTYSISASVSLGWSASGYASSYGDGGIAEFSMGASNIVGLSVSYGGDPFISHLGISGTHASATGIGGSPTYGALVYCCRASGVGVGIGALGAVLVECETYNCAQGLKSFTAAVNCYAQASTQYGFYLHNALAKSGMFRCIADSCSGGFFLGQGSCVCDSCDSYNCSGTGFTNYYTNSGHIYRNCNAVKCGTGFSLNTNETTKGIALLVNCGFGGGAYANTNNVNSGGVASQVGSVNYTSHPWVSPDTGDFRIASGEAKGTGIGVFPQTFNSKTGTIGYPDIGAAQHLDSGGGSVIVMEDD